jgi:hypothetical protein
LAKALGYQPIEVDHTGGYGVVRVLVGLKKEVFRPTDKHLPVVLAYFAGCGGSLCDDYVSIPLVDSSCAIWHGGSGTLLVEGLVKACAIRARIYDRT